MPHAITSDRQCACQYTIQVHSGVIVQNTGRLRRNDFTHSMSHSCLSTSCIVMAALCNRAGHYIFALWFLPSSSSFFLFSSPNLSSHRLDVNHTSTHGAALVQIYNAGLKCAARSLLEMQDPKIAKNLPSRHHCRTLLGYIFTTKARINNRKKIDKQ